MHKRVVDGGALWKAEKIARIQPEWIRAEYANWIPLALANGSFETDARRIWATVYSFNRPDISVEDTEDIRREFCRVGLLFLWADEASGKIWGYFTGIEKPGRLPAKSRLDKKHEPIGPIPPADAHRSYVELTRAKALDAVVVSRWLANGCLGFGFGTGLGIGKTPSQKTTSPSTKCGAVTVSRRQKSAPGDVRHQLFVDFAFESYKTKHGRDPLWQGKNFSTLKRLLKSQPAEKLPLDRLLQVWNNFMASTEAFTVKQRDSFAYFCTNIDKFSDGPIQAAPGMGINGKPDINEAVATTMRGFAVNAGITH